MSKKYFTIKFTINNHLLSVHKVLSSKSLSNLLLERMAIHVYQAVIELEYVDDIRIFFLQRLW